LHEEANTHQIQATLNRWRTDGREIDSQTLHHIAPMGYEHINCRYFDRSYGALPLAAAAFEFTAAQRHDDRERARMLTGGAHTFG
jgi:hypothetical protein